MLSCFDVGTIDMTESDWGQTIDVETIETLEEDKFLKAFEIEYYERSKFLRELLDVKSGKMLLERLTIYKKKILS